jgi:transposase
MEIDKIEALRLDHLGLVAQMADDIFLSETIDKLVGDVDSQEIISIGQAVQAMCINCLGFTTRALHLTPQFFKTRDIKFLIGRNKGRANIVLKPEHLNEHKLGRALDAIAEVGTDKLFMSVALTAFRSQNVKVPSLHLDTTTHSVYGTYEPKNKLSKENDIEQEEVPISISITHGYSKDHRNDCKQFVQELLVSSDGDVPLMFKAHSGNKADIAIFEERLKALKKQFKDTESEDLIPKFIVGDCKFYSEQTLKNCQADSINWVTRVPDNIVEAKRCFKESLKNEEWLEQVYEGDKKISYQVFDVEKYKIKQRFIVVKTDYSMKRSEKTEERRFEKEKKSLELFQKKLEKKYFSCESDLDADLREKCKKLVYFKLKSFNVNEIKTHKKKGRPALGAEAIKSYGPTDIVFEEKENVKTQQANENSCFIIGTTDFNSAAPDIIQIYRKDQQGVERSFRFLKDPSYFADAFFLKNPARIEALLCVMTISLLLYALLQRKLRLNLKAEQKFIPDQKKKLYQKPTMRWVNMNFEGVDVTKIHVGDDVKYYFHRMNKFVEVVLDVLGPQYQNRYSELWLS